MDINQFTASETVPPHYILMIGLDYTQRGAIAVPVLVYSGLAAAMETARLSIVHPGTLAAIKSGADALLDAAEEQPLHEHSWVPRFQIGHPDPVDQICSTCGASKNELTANQR